MTQTEAAPSSVSRFRRLGKNLYDLPTTDDELLDAAVHHAVAYPTNLAEGEGKAKRRRHSSRFLRRKKERASVDFTEQLPSSPLATQLELTVVNQQSLITSNMPMTPEATQQPDAGRQSSRKSDQLEKILLITPQRTQTSSAGVRSFTGDAEMEDASSDPLIKPSPVNLSRPRHKVPTVDVASWDASTNVHSADASCSEDELAPTSNIAAPSIGLSTPVAYYTPLKDLPFFLNRSSQFHSSSFPDIIALATSATTPPKRAKSSPKHYNTTLHITDLSTYPSTTAVQVFRPYENALPIAAKGDVILLRSFSVKSFNRRPMLVSGDESAWCVWRYSTLLWGRKRGAFGEVKAREDIRGPTVERGEGEWREVEKLRAWYTGTVQEELEDMTERGIQTRSKDKVGKGSTTGVRS